MALTDQQINLTKRIDQHVEHVIRDGGADEELLLSMGDYMGTFKQVMDMSTHEEMQLLGEQYPGFYRFAKLLEAMAEGIQNGSIRVP